MRGGIGVRVGAAVVGVALLATGCGSGGGSGKEAAASDPGTPSPVQQPVKAPDPATLTAFTSQKPVWTDCPKGPELPAGSPKMPEGKCTKIKVPLDYAEPDGETIEIAVNKFPATGEKRGSLFVNPGGPGGSGLGFAPAIPMVSPEVGKAYDVIGFDPRGVGESKAVECLDTAAKDAYYAAGPTPRPTADGKAAWRKAAKAMADGCEAKSGKLLPHVGTENVARDIDVMRAVLGEKKTDYAGVSYGTLLGAYYAEQYPEHIDRMYLDSVMDPARTLPGIIEDNAASFQKAYEAFLARCAEDKDGDQEPCPMGKDPKATDAAIQKLAKDLEAKPVAAKSDPKRPVSGSDLRDALTEGLGQAASWPKLTKTLGSALKGDLDGVREDADGAHGRKEDGSYGSTDQSYLAVACQFATDEDRSHEALDAALVKATKKSALFGPVDTFRPCADWAAKSAAPAREIKTSGTQPILLAQNTGDPATPLAWAQAAQKMLGGSALATNEAFGHGYLTAGACTMKVFGDYLAKGTVPGAGSECHDSGMNQSPPAAE
ncbi:alpha/beta hydrolase [Streptomyces spiroverticillatus]|uniref:Alpha/beta hydrolase n=2 Tax=Streptomyces finlayi TaxID=67296 RepID=A0A918WTX4_9ACTN|nr:alpha/beta hydrolase [Streptomyces spiroverticillatus]GHC83247.1 alpha/beta hydrolase [Streptomyces finlayi]